MCHCLNSDDYCDDWDERFGNRDSGSRLAWGVMLLLAAAFWSMVISACASWKAMSPAQKHQAAVDYYQTFSTGLKIGASFLPSDKQPVANTVIAVADAAIQRLDQSYQAGLKEDALKQVEVEAAAKLEAANAVVGASNG